MYISDLFLNQMADHAIDYVQGKTKAHISEISNELTRHFSLPTDLSNDEFKSVTRRAKDRGQLRDPRIAFMPLREQGTRAFRGWWTATPDNLDAIAHADLVIRSTATRVRRDGRNYRIVYAQHPDVNLYDRIDAVRLMELAAEYIDDDIKGVVRSDAYKLKRLQEMTNLAGRLAS